MARPSVSLVRPLAPYLAVVLGVAALYAPALLHGGLLYGYDTIHEILYRRMWGFGLLGEGRLPLWNPHVLAGVPFLGDTINGMVYPPNVVLHLLLPAPLAINLTIALHVLLAGAGMLAFLRSGLGFRAAPAVLGAFSYMFGAFMTGHVFLGSMEHLVASAWWPVGFFCVEKAIGTRGWRPALAGAFVLAASITGGHLQFVYFGCLAWCLYGLLKAATRGSADGHGPGAAMRALAPLAILLLVGVALSALVVLPMASLYRGSIRAGGLGGESSLSGAALPPWQALNLLAPTFFGDTIRTPYWGAMGQEMVTAYLGVLPFLLALLPAPSGRRAEIAFFRVLALFGLLMAFGRHTPFAWAANHVLPFSTGFRHPARWLGLFALGASVAAAGGLESILRDGTRLRRVGWAASLLLAACLAVLGSLFLGGVDGAAPAWFGRFHAWAARASTLPAGGPPMGPVWVGGAFACSRASLVQLAVLLAVALAWIALCKRSSARTRALVGPAAVTIAFLDLAGYTARYLVTVDPNDYLWGPEVASKLEAGAAGPFRIATLFPSTAVPYPGLTALTHGRIYSSSESHNHRGMVLGLSNIGGTPSMMPRAYRDLVLGSEAIHFAEGRVISRPILDLLDVRYVLTPTEGRPPWEGGEWEDLGTVEEMRVWRNGRAVPRAFFPEEIRFGLAPLDEMHEPGFDPRRVAYLSEVEGAECLGESDGSPAGAGAPLGEAEFRRYGETEVELEVHAPVGGWLVVTDEIAPGWRATVDGAPTPIVRADAAFRAVCVPPGGKVVRFRYSPWFLAVGATISALALLACGGVLVATRRTTS